MKRVTVMSVSLYGVESTDPRVVALTDVINDFAESREMESPVFTTQTYKVYRFIDVEETVGEGW